MNRLLLILLIFSGLLSAQTTDTLLHKELDELLVAYSIPINSDKMVAFYQTNQFASIDDINSRMPGMSMVRRGAYALEPQMGGFSGGQINVTIDGMHIFGACTDKMDPVTSYVETDNLQGINLNYGTNGINFGSTVGGALNMQLYKPLFTASDNSSVKFGYGYESISEGHNSSLLINHSQQKFAFRGNISYRNHQSYKDGEKQMVAFSQFSKLNLYGSTAYKINKSSYLQANIIYDEATDVGYPALPMDVATAQGQIYSLAYYNKTLGKFNNLEAKLYYNDIYHLMDDSQRDSLFYINDGQDSVYMRMDMPGWSNTAGAYAQGELNINTRNKIDIKAEIYRNNLRADMTMFMRNAAHPNEPPMYTETWPETERIIGGLFARYTRYITSKSKLNISIQNENSLTRMTSVSGKQQFSIFNETVSGKYYRSLINGNVGFKQHISNQLQVEIGSGYGQRLPTITEQFGFYLFNAQDGYDYIGNPDIKPEKSLQGNLALSLNNSSFKARYYGQWSYIKDYIYGQYRSDIPKMNLYAQGSKQYINISFANIINNHIELMYMPVQNITLISVNQFTYGYNNKNEALPQIAPFSSTNMVQYHKNNFNFNLELLYSAEQNRIDSNYGETPTDDYLLLNARMQYYIFIKKQQLNLLAGVDNIGNKVYKAHLDWGKINRPGRNYIIQISYLF